MLVLQIQAATAWLAVTAHVATQDRHHCDSDGVNCAGTGESVGRVRESALPASIARCLEVVRSGRLLALLANARMRARALTRALLRDCGASSGCCLPFHAVAVPAPASSMAVAATKQIHPGLYQACEPPGGCPGQWQLRREQYVCMCVVG